MVHPDCVLGQNPPPNVQYTNKAVDLGLRSNLTVNPSTRALEIQIPLGSYPGRAGLDVPIAISYSSKVHNIKYYAYNPGHYSSSGVPIGDGYSMVVARFAEYSSAGWTSTVGFPGSDYSAQYEKYNMFGQAVGPDGQCPYSPCLTVDRVLFRMPDGSTHELRSTDQPRFPDDPLIDNYYSVDGARMRYQKSTDTLFMADGSRYLFGQGKYVDRNGNTITISTDTLGRPIPYPPMNGTGLNGGTPGDADYFIQGVGGAINYRFKWRYLDDPGVLTSPQPLQYVANSTCPYGTGSYSPYLFFGDGGTHTCILNGGSIFRPVVLYQILLPTGQAYTFTYNIYGEIDKVVLPTGGYERYEYAQFGALTNMVAPYIQANRGVTRRYVSPSGLPADELPPWQYSGDGGYVSITAPDNSLTILSLYTDPSMSGTFGYSLDQARAGRTYSENFYSPPDGNGARQLLRRHLSDWSVTGSNATGLFPTAQQYATRNARLTKEVEIVLDTGTSNALAKTTVHNYDLTYEFSIGPIETSVNEYDWVVIDQSTAQSAAIGSIPLGSLLRTQESTNLILDPNISQSVRDAYRALNLLSLATSTRIKNALGTIVAQSSISYDEYSLTPIGSIPSWTDPQTVYRGNATTASNWLDTTGTNLQTHKYYDQFGNVRTAVDAKGNQSQIDYSSNYQFAYPTTATTAVPDPSGQYASTSPFSITTNYDVNTGKVVSTTDANAKTTSYDYTDALNRLTQVTLPDTGRVRYYYSNTPGDLYVQVLTDEDSSRSIETRKYFDGLGRPTRGFLFDGTPSTPWTVTDSYYDTMGRVSQVSNPYRVGSPGASVPPTCAVCTTSAYDALGRVKSVTTPDSAQVTTSYGALTSGSIFGTTVLVTDQTGKSRRSLTDSLGRLARVDEPDVNGNLGDVSSPVQPTTYSYDVLGNLRLVTQGAQQRFFMYDSLSRLLRARNPELAVNGNLPALTDPITGNGQWSTAYTYDNNGNLTQKTDARGVVSSYAYDALNRNTSIVYTNDPTSTPAVYRYYDGFRDGTSQNIPNSNGSLWQTETTGAKALRTTINNFDALGRPLSQSQQFDSFSPFTTQRTLNLAGLVISQTYPSVHIVAYTYDVAGRTEGFNGNLGDAVQRNYSTEILYSSLGGLTKEKLGTNTTPIYNKLLYNSRGQLAEMRASTSYTGPTDTTSNRGKFINWYSLQCGGAACNSSENNGNLRKQETSVPNSDQNNSPTAWYQQYDYDSLNRLERVREYTGNTSLDWQQSYSYDRWGNRTINIASGATFGSGINAMQTTIDSATNRLYAPNDPTHALIQYDVAGNQTKDSYSGNGERQYDAENRMIAAQDNLGGWTYYAYDGDGKRVRSWESGAGTSGAQRWQVYGFDGELVAEYTANPAPRALMINLAGEYGYRNGQLLVKATVGTTLTPDGGGGFESPNVGNGNYVLNPSGSGWSFSGTTGISGKNSALTIGNPTAPEGNQVAFIQGGSTSIISQTISGLTPGATYAVTFSAAQRGNCCGAGGEDFRVLLVEDTGSVPVGTFKPTTTDYRDYSTIVFSPLGSIAALQFVGLNSSGGDNTALIDNVRIVIIDNVEWMVADQLGTPRMVFDKTGTLANVKRHDYLPFGEELMVNQGLRTNGRGYGSPDGVRQQFTQKERDNETGLDYFLARYYSSTQGRFTSPDPLGGHTEDPQTLDRYTYVRNNPQTFTDPKGLDFYLTCKEEGGTCHKGQVGTYDKRGNFTATIIRNDKNGGLVDQNGNVYTAKITGQGVSFNGAGSKEYTQGVFLNGTNATTIQGSGDLTGFTFNFTSSNLDTHITAKGTFTFSGSAEQAEQALEKANYLHYTRDVTNVLHPSTDTYNAVDYRSPGESGTGIGSGHFTVHEPVKYIWLFKGPAGAGQLRVPVHGTVPSGGDIHFGETNPYTGGFFRHAKEVIHSIRP